jgi:hypothetical protein
VFILPKDVIWVYIRKNENSITREISFELWLLILNYWNR